MANDVSNTDVTVSVLLGIQAGGLAGVSLAGEETAQ